MKKELLVLMGAFASSSSALSETGNLTMEKRLKTLHPETLRTALELSRSGAVFTIEGKHYIDPEQLSLEVENGHFHWSDEVEAFLVDKELAQILVESKIWQKDMPKEKSSQGITPLHLFSDEPQVFVPENSDFSAFPFMG